MNTNKDNSPKEYKIDIATTYPQTFLDGTKLNDSACQNCRTSSCQNCQNGYVNSSQTNDSTEQGYIANQPNMQDLLPMLLQSLGGKSDISSLLPLISKFSQNMPQDGASAIQNLLNFLPKKQNKTSAQNTQTDGKTSGENKFSNNSNSQIDNFEVIKNL